MYTDKGLKLFEPKVTGVDIARVALVNELTPF